MTTTDEAAVLEVTQADRDAAADLAAQFQRYTYVQIEAPAIRRGEHDDWELVLSFARNRTTERDRLLASQERAIAEAVAKERERCLAEIANLQAAAVEIDNIRVAAHYVSAFRDAAYAIRNLTTEGNEHG